jgi:hypothetical protein
MGGRIPKRAQREIDKANIASAARRTKHLDAIANVPVPRVMDSNTPRNIMNLHEVYFNDELQMLCTVADVNAGCIIRWNKGKGNHPAKDAELERLFGKVEIRRKRL